MWCQICHMSTVWCFWYHSDPHILWTREATIYCVTLSGTYSYSSMLKVNVCNQWMSKWSSTLYNIQTGIQLSRINWLWRLFTTFWMGWQNIFAQTCQMSLIWIPYCISDAWKLRWHLSFYLSKMKTVYDAHNKAIARRAIKLQGQSVYSTLSSLA